jgi:uncharacterized protein (TIGR02271 family)
MITKAVFFTKYADVEKLNDAYTRDGHKLGSIVALDDDSVTIEKGFFFPKDFTIRYDDIDDIRDGNLILKYDKKDFDSWRNEKYEGWTDYDTQAGAGTTTEETNIPLHEEELEARTRERQKGEIRIRKVVHTELKTFTVPVRKEEVIIEKAPAAETTTDLKTSGKAFQEEEVNIPVMEEEVDVTKKQKVTGEIRVRKQSRTEQKKVSGEVRKEDVEVNKKDEEHRKAA